jgi:hypothetical protein
LGLVTSSRASTWLLQMRPVPGGGICAVYTATFVAGSAMLLMMFVGAYCRLSAHPAAAVAVAGLRAHKLVEEYPDSALAWFGVGCYYMASRQFEQSRCFFAKATQLDKHHAHSWICFGHAFAEQVRWDRPGQVVHMCHSQRGSCQDCSGASWLVVARFCYACGLNELWCSIAAGRVCVAHARHIAKAISLGCSSGGSLPATDGCSFHYCSVLVQVCPLWPCACILFDCNL